MENEAQNSILIGEVEQNDNKSNNGDIFEKIYYEMKESLKVLKEEELKKKKETENKDDKINEDKKIDDDLMDFVVLDKTPEKKRYTPVHDSDTDDF